MIICKYDPKEHARILYNMELHETLKFSEELYVTRVPGGWIYDRVMPRTEMMASIFIPYNDEFKEHEDLRNIPVCEKIDNCEGTI